MGKWYTAAGSGRMAYVIREDTARAAAAAMLEGSSNIRYDSPVQKHSAEIAVTIHDLHAL